MTPLTAGLPQEVVSTLGLRLSSDASLHDSLRDTGPNRPDSIVGFASLVALKTASTARVQMMLIRLSMCRGNCFVNRLILYESSFSFSTAASYSVG